MIIGASSIASPIEELIGEVDSIELYVPKMGLYNGRSLQQDKVEAIMDILSTSSGITSVHAPYYAEVKTYPSDLCVDMADMNRSDFLLMEETIELAAYFQSEVVVIHPGLVGADRSRSLSMMIDNLEQLANIAGNHGVMLGLENKEGTAPENLCCSAKELVWTVKQVNSGNMGITFDVGHANLTTGGDREQLGQFMETVREWVVHLHVHDNMGVWTDEYAGDMHMAPGSGTVDLSVIGRLGFSGIHNIEVFSLDDVMAGKKRLLEL